MIILCEYSSADVSLMCFVYLFFLLPFPYSFSITVPFYGYGYRRSLHLPTLIFSGLGLVIYLREMRQKGSKQSKR